MTAVVDPGSRGVHTLPIGTGAGWQDWSVVDRSQARGVSMDLFSASLARSRLLSLGPGAEAWSTWQLSSVFMSLTTQRTLTGISQGCVSSLTDGVEGANATRAGSQRFVQEVASTF